MASFAGIGATASFCAGVRGSTGGSGGLSTTDCGSVVVAGWSALALVGAAK